MFKMWDFPGSPVNAGLIPGGELGSHRLWCDQKKFKMENFFGEELLLFILYFFAITLYIRFSYEENTSKDSDKNILNLNDTSASPSACNKLKSIAQTVSRKYLYH